MFEDMSGATGKCPCRALDTETTHMATNVTMNDIYNGRVSRFGDTRVYRPTNTHFNTQTSKSKDDTYGNGAGYFASRKYSYRDGYLSALKQTCREVTLTCRMTCRQENDRVSRCPWVVSDKVGRVHTYVYSCPTKADQICEYGHCLSRKETELEGRRDTSVGSRINGAGSSCSGSVLDSTTPSTTDRFPDSRACITIQDKGKDNNSTNVLLSRTDAYTTLLQDKKGASHTTCVQNNNGDRSTIRAQNNRADRCTTLVHNNAGDCGDSSVHDNRQGCRSVQNKREDGGLNSVHNNNRGRSIISVKNNRAVTHGVQNNREDSPVSGVHTNRECIRPSSVHNTEDKLNNVRKIRGESCTTSFQNIRRDKCTSSMQNIRGVRRTTTVQGIRADKRAANVQKIWGDIRSVPFIRGDKRSVPIIFGDKRTTSIQNISEGSLTERARNCVCSNTKMPHSVVQYNENCTAIIKQTGSTNSSGHIHHIMNSCKTFSQTERSKDYTTTEYSKGVKQNYSSTGNSVINIVRNIDRVYTSSIINGNAENRSSTRHKYGAIQGNTVLRNENIDTATRCTQHPDVNGSTGDIKPFTCEHARDQALNVKVVHCQCSVPTSGAEDARNCSSDRAQRKASSVHGYGNKKVLIASHSDGFLEKKFRYDHLPISESFSTGRVQSTYPIQTLCVSNIDQSHIPSIDAVTSETSRNYSTDMFSGCQEKSTHIMDSVTPRDSRNCSTHVLLGCQKRTVPRCPPHVCSQSPAIEPLGHYRCNNLLTNRHVGNLLQPFTNLAIAEVPSVHRRDKLNRDIWPTETKNKTWANDVKVGKEHKSVCKFTRAHELSHKRTNTERTSQIKPVSHSQSAEYCTPQQKKAARPTKAYFIKKTDILDKSSEPTIPNRDSSPTLSQTSKQTSALVRPGAEGGPTSSCPIIHINSQPADTDPHGFVLSVEDVDGGGMEDAIIRTVAVRKGGLLSVPGSEVYFEGRPDLSEQ